MTLCIVSSGVLVATGAKPDFRLVDVSGNAAVAYIWDNGLARNADEYQTELRFIRALDPTGSSWPGSAVTLTNYGVLHGLYEPRLMMLGTVPAIAFVHDNSNLYEYKEVVVVKAANTTGSSWGSQVRVDLDYIDAAKSLSFALVNGNPALASFGSQWVYAESSNGGSSFLRYAIGNFDYPRGALADVHGKPAITMFSYSNGDYVVQIPTRHESHPWKLYQLDRRTTVTSADKGDDRWRGFSYTVR